MFTRGTSPVLKALVVKSIHGKLEIERGFAISHSLNTTSTSVSRIVFGIIGSILGQTAIIYTSAIISTLVILPALKYSKEKE
jgi:CheY-specific phosphatase CheX